MTPSGIYGRSWSIAAPVLLVSVVLNVVNARAEFSPLGAFVCAVVTLGAAIALYYALERGASRKSRWTYSVGPAGLVRTRHGKVSLIPWEDMAEITSSSVEHWGRRTVEFSIVTSQLRRILIGPGTENHLRIGEQVLRQASRQYLCGARQSLAEAGRVQFGKLWITQHELGHGRKSVRWRSLRAAHFEQQRGRFVFRAQETSSRDFCTVDVEEIPYLAVFVELIHSMPVPVENVVRLAGVRALV